MDELLWERKAGLCRFFSRTIRLDCLPPDGVRDRGPTLELDDAEGLRRSVEVGQAARII